VIAVVIAIYRLSLISAFGTFIGMSNPRISRKSFHTRQPTLSTYQNIAGDD
jgi:hypothetical protein